MSYTPIKINVKKVQNNYCLKRYTDVYHKRLIIPTNNHILRFSTFCYSDYGRNNGRTYFDQRAFLNPCTPKDQNLEFPSDQTKTQNPKYT